MNDLNLSVIQHPGVWRASEGLPATAHLRQPSGHASLDDALNGGVPSSGLVRIRSHLGVGELSFLQRILSNQTSHKLLAFVNPPGRLQADWLTQLDIALQHVYVVQPADSEAALWATEQCVKSGACRQVVLWMKGLQPKQARRLQVAASHNHTLCLLLESVSSARQPLPVALDMELHNTGSGLRVQVLKQQGGWPQDNIRVEFRHTPANDAIIRAMNPASPVCASVIQAG